MISYTSSEVISIITAQNFIFLLKNEIRLAQTSELTLFIKTKSKL